MHSSKIKIYIKCLSYSEVNDVIKKVISFKIPGWFRNTNERKCFLFDSVQLICSDLIQCHKANFKSGDSYIDSPDQIKKKKAKINPKNEGDKCFQYAGTVAINYEKINWNLERFSIIKSFINKYKI